MELEWIPTHLAVTEPFNRTTTSVPVDTHSFLPWSAASTRMTGPAIGVAPSQAAAAGGVVPTVGDEPTAEGDAEAEVDSEVDGEADDKADELPHAVMASKPPMTSVAATGLLIMISS